MTGVGVGLHLTALIMSIQVILGYVKILVGFLLLWGGFWVWNNIGCRRIEGTEMDPALKKDAGEWVAPRIRRPDQLQRDNFVSYTITQSGKGRVVAARVIGLPGDRVRVVEGEVYLNGSKLPSNYVPRGQNSKETLEEMIVPRDHVYVLCDGRSGAFNAALDSRKLGPIGQWAITGKFGKFW